MDQVAAEQLGSTLRFPSLVFSVGEKHAGLISVTRAAALIPPEENPSQLYRRLFLPDSPEESARRLADIERGTSIVDHVLDRTLERESADPAGGRRVPTRPASGM